MDLWIEIAKQAPYMVIVVIIIKLLLDREDKRDDKRTENAKALEYERTTNAKDLEHMRMRHETEINAMWANAIKNLMDSQMATTQMIAEALEANEKASQERYEKMGITKELFNAAKEQLKK